MFLFIQQTLVLVDVGGISVLWTNCGVVQVHGAFSSVNPSSLVHYQVHLSWVTPKLLGTAAFCSLWLFLVVLGCFEHHQPWNFVFRDVLTQNNSALFALSNGVGHEPIVTLCHAFSDLANR